MATKILNDNNGGNNNGPMECTLEFDSQGPRSFPWRAEYIHMFFNSDIANSLLKNNGER